MEKEVARFCKNEKKKNRSKRIFAFVLAATCLLFSCFLGGCANGKTGNAFTFLSVRMKGDGKGNITAYAEKEFSLFAPEISVTLTIFYGETAVAGGGDGEKVACVSVDDIGAVGKVFATCAAKDGYYFARLDYVLNGETRSVKTDTVCYSSDGKRVKNG
ncbi:MAG TPA: hypothetical protein DDY77_01850 [Clostridiales bacterium]|nr:hypothetical protein [Clostridiales bacterium]